MKSALWLGSLALALTVTVALSNAVAEELPEALRGFSGQVRGVVVAKQEGRFTFKVARVLHVWDGNKAATPELIVGRTIPVGPRWQQNDQGQWQRVERHVAFIRTLKAGQEITLEVRNVEGDHFALLELSKEQRELAEGGAPREDGAREDGDKDAARRIGALEEQVRLLRAEIAELKELLKQLGN